MSELLTNVLKNLSVYLTNYKAVSEEELMWRIDQEIDALTDDEKKNLDIIIEDDAKQAIFESIIGKQCMSVFCPDMHVKLNFSGEVFYCPPSHKYIPEEMEKGFKRLINLRFEKIFPEIKKTVLDLMTKSGYKTIDNQSPVAGEYCNIKAIKNDKEIQLLIFQSIIFIPEKFGEVEKITGDYAMIVPPEKSPAPFVSFIRDNINTISGNPRMMIWLANHKENVVSPFMNMTEDLEIWNNFTNPERSLQATQNLITGAMRSTPLDEDF